VSAPVWLAFGLGLLIGAWCVCEYFIRRERPTIKIEVTPEVAQQISTEMVHAWLKKRDLVALPKGKEFTWPGEVKK